MIQKFFFLPTVHLFCCNQDPQKSNPHHCLKLCVFYLVIASYFWSLSCFSFFSSSFSRVVLCRLLSLYFSSFSFLSSVFLLVSPQSFLFFLVYLSIFFLLFYLFIFFYLSFSRISFSLFSSFFLLSLLFFSVFLVHLSVKIFMFNITSSFHLALSFVHSFLSSLDALPSSNYPYFSFT